MPFLVNRLTELLRLGREGLRLVTRTIMRHCSLNNLYHTIGIRDSHLCRADETIVVVYFECTCIIQIRSETLETTRSYTDVLKPGDLITYYSPLEELISDTKPLT